MPFRCCTPFIATLVRGRVAVVRLLQFSASRSGSRVAFMFCSSAPRRVDCWCPPTHARACFLVVVARAGGGGAAMDAIVATARRCGGGGAARQWRRRGGSSTAATAARRRCGAGHELEEATMGSDAQRN
ncbi:uncharacterized protein Tco025E_09202 [Trypanosoma conorhini]|uniref:Uncharacterized protein n=1 Tax=Trypanosoma conorhini TaxID=83891 RepID=A0A3R7KDU6_9TRYP|nr:uncharacterized protein Tco025E_09202 [Trypanosoma conorhini]RNE98526.1 hypothetical protein Tco025E_09202 [Trypanosoma conorhini]